MRVEYNKILKLDGESAEYARMYDAAMTARRLPQNIPEQRAIQECSARDAAKAAGFTTPVIRIHHYHDGYPRAYFSYPVVFFSDVSENEFYLIAPVGYDGKYNTPKGAYALTDAEATRVMDCHFAGGHTAPAFLFMKRDIGTDIPADYNPETSTHAVINKGRVAPNRSYIFLRQIPEAHLCECESADRTVTTFFNDKGQRIFLEIPELRTENTPPRSITPQVIRLPSGLLLAYPHEAPELVTVTLPGFERITPAQAQWEEANEHDKAQGITPPPRPKNWPKKESLAAPDPVCTTPQIR